VIESQNLPAKATLSAGFIEALPMLAAVVKRSTVPILEHILIQVSDGKLTARTTDLETSVEYTEGKQCGTDFSVTVPCKQFAVLLKGAKEADFTVLSRTSAYVTVGGARISLANVFPGDDFPVKPEIGKAQTSFTVGLRELRDTLGKVAKFASNEDARGAVLMGTLIEVPKFLQDDSIEVGLTSTDGYKLGQFVLNAKGAVQVETDHRGFILPRASETAKLLGKFKIKKGMNPNITAILGDGRVHNLTRFCTGLLNDSCGVIEVIVRQVDGQYPNYRNVIPEKYDRAFRVNANEFLARLRTAAAFSKDRVNLVVIESSETETGHQITVTGQDDESAYTGYVHLPPNDYHGFPIKIAFNGKSLIDCVTQAASGDDVQIQMLGPLSPIKITDPLNPTTQVVLMPLRQ
jgi:DNA polymerase-3 subunit beta